MREVELPALPAAEAAAWRLVVELAEAGLPRWVLAGGLMVHLHLHEAGVRPVRVTTDVDAIVDVSIRTRRATEEFSRRLRDDLGMRLDGPDADGLGHRFVREADGAVVDVLAADFGRRSRPHRTLPPARTLEVPGGRRMLDAAEPVRLRHEGRTVTVERPDLSAAVIAKVRAFHEIASTTGDDDRHLIDAAALLSILDPDTAPWRRSDRRHLEQLRQELEARPALAGRDIDVALDTLALILGP